MELVCVSLSPSIIIYKIKINFALKKTILLEIHKLLDLKGLSKYILMIPLLICLAHWKVSAVREALLPASVKIKLAVSHYVMSSTHTKIHDA